MKIWLIFDDFSKFLWDFWWFLVIFCDFLSVFERYCGNFSHFWWFFQDSLRIFSDFWWYFEIFCKILWKFCSFLVIFWWFLKIFSNSCHIRIFWYFWWYFAIFCQFLKDIVEILLIFGDFFQDSVELLKILWILWTVILYHHNKMLEVIQDLRFYWIQFRFFWQLPYEECVGESLCIGIDCFLWKTLYV